MGQNAIWKGSGGGRVGQEGQDGVSFLKQGVDKGTMLFQWGFEGCRGTMLFEWGMEGVGGQWYVDGVTAFQCVMKWLRVHF